MKFVTGPAKQGISDKLHIFRKSHLSLSLLNQARAGRKPARAWFLRIASVRECLYACVFVCVRLRGYE